MSFDIIKNYVKNRVEGLGYIESKMPFDFENASAREYDNHFILMPSEGSIDPDGANLNISVFDSQVWELYIAFSKSTLNDILKRDDMFRSIEAIIVDMDNPANYSGTVDLIRYDSWVVEEQENYFLLNIKFIIRTQYNY